MDRNLTICFTSDIHGYFSDMDYARGEPGTKAGPVSTVATLAIANSIVLHACEIMRSHGKEPKVFHSGNCPGSDGYNAAILAEYMPRVRHL